MDSYQSKVTWQGTVVSVQPRNTVWRYLTDNRTHRENGEIKRFVREIGK